MKKHVKHDSQEEPLQGGPDISELIGKMHQQLIYLEKKIDTLIGQSSARPADERQHSRPFQRPENAPRQREYAQNNNYRERTLHKAVCAECSKECQVPFRPTGDRPVYCRDCFAKRKARDPFNDRRDSRPAETGAPRHGGGSGVKKGSMRKFGERKVKFSKKRKKHS